MRAVISLVAAGLIFGALGCGQEPPAEQSGSRAAGATPEATAETTGEAADTASSSAFSDVVASYSVAQEEIEEAGGEKEVGLYRVGFVVESAEGWWEGEGTNLQWRDPAASETNHLEILPFDKESGLLVPYMDIDLAVLDESGKEVARQDLNFYWAEFLHYANNFSLPKSGTYTLRAELNPPEFMRHGSEEGEGKVFAEPVTVEFEGVEIDAEGG